MNKYNNGKIYKITNQTNDIYYIGSTYEKLTNRFNRHKNKYKIRYNNGSVFTLFDIYGVNNCHIELIENYPCETKKQLHTRERHHILENITKCVNKKIPKPHI
jgi:hypothetical protein